MKVLCFALFACAFNLLLGYVGLLSFGHAAYFGMGAYVTAWTVKNWGLPPETGILAGGLTRRGAGGSCGGLAIRRQGLYFAMITLALAQMVYFFCVQAPFTGGEDGIQAGAARQSVWHVPLELRHGDVLFSCRSCSWSASCSSIASCTRRSGRC